jgi:hypothetical protein
MVVALRGFGLVALVTVIFLNAIFPLLRTAMAWSGGSGVFMLVALIALIAYACYIAIKTSGVFLTPQNQKLLCFLRRQKDTRGH